MKQRRLTTIDVPIGGISYSIFQAVTDQQMIRRRKLCCMSSSSCLVLSHSINVAVVLSNYRTAVTKLLNAVNVSVTRRFGYSTYFSSGNPSVPALGLPCRTSSYLYESLMALYCRLATQCNGSSRQVLMNLAYQHQHHLDRLLDWGCIFPTPEPFDLKWLIAAVSFSLVP
ncbi:hypothetical protein O9993_20230 [Vibrio lentus]|nr:hypothetical protein [Vibrio lentus]